MPLPMVPAPSTPRGGRAGRQVLGHVGDARHRALGEEDVDERLALVGEEALEEQLRLARQPCVEGQAHGRLDGLDALRGREQAVRLPAHGLAGGRERGRAGLRVAQLVRPVARARVGAARRQPLAQERDAGQVAVQQSRSTMPWRSASSADGSPCTHISSLGHARQRGRRCVPPAPGMRPSFTSGLAELRRGHSRAVVAAHGHLQPVTKAVPWMAQATGLGKLPRG
jgi:hypothetical protein